MKPAILYISYDGMLEPLGQSQVLSYLKPLARGRKIHLISYEKGADWMNVAERERIRREVADAGIAWHPLRYHKRPTAIATAWDILVGIALGVYLVLRHRLALVHARSYVASVIALALKRLTRVRYLFDMRGFWADERVDGMLWAPTSRLYRVAKWFERRFLLEADHVVSLTHAAVRELAKFPYLRERMPAVTVIPTCADLQHFRPAPQGAGAPFTLGYVGSAGTWYNFDAAVAAFQELRRCIPDARLLVINRNEHEYIRDRLRVGGVSTDSVEIHAARHADVPTEMARMSAGVFFVKPLFSKQASAPTKLAEFLGCGIPCLTNSGVGDMAAILEDNQVGVALPDFTPASLARGVAAIVQLTRTPNLRERCVSVAYQHFHLDTGVAQYAHVYRSLLADAPS